MNNEQTQKPTPDQVREWAAQDIRAAIHFLNMILNIPEVLELVTDQVIKQAEMFDAHRKKQEELKQEEV